LAIAVEHHQAGRLQAAEQIYRQVLAVDSHQADAWHLLGVIADQVGKHAIAVEYIAYAIRLAGDQAVFHQSLGDAYRALGRTADAVSCYRRALELKPDLADARNKLDAALKDQAKPDGAVACCRRAPGPQPDSAESQNGLGIALKNQGNLDGAVACYRRALDLNPAYAEAHNNLANALKDQGKADEAVACYRRALELKPDYAEIHNNLGAALKDQGRLDEAVACCRRAVELKPDFADAHNNLGAALRNLGNLDGALACYRRALELKPDYAAAHNNLGNVLKDQGNLDATAACYRRALELKPDYADCHLHLAMVQLLAGDFAHGWAGYEWRLNTKQCPRRNFSQPCWDGRPLEGRAILLHAEQGLGDAIQFVRYAALVKQRGGLVTLECPRPLLSLLATCLGMDRLVGQGDALPAFDVQAPLPSLPGIFHTALHDIPAAIPYLFAASALAERWRRELGPIAGFRIGIVWQGNPTHPNDRHRSIPLACFEPLARCSGVQLLSLQKGAGVEQLQQVAERFPVAELGSRLNDFMDTAAVMMNLDLVITCDTSVAHLAGALGVPVWVALPFIADWRWMLDRSDSPWYPTMRLFRQESRGDWQGVFRRLAVALGERLAGRAMRPVEKSQGE
jgi:tetratricopeptide (TPR) repeat protein